MVNDFDKMAMKFNEAEKRLVDLLEADNDPPIHLLGKLDHRVEEAFEALFEDDLNDSESRIERLEFFVSRLKKIADDHDIMRKMLDRMEADLSDLKRVKAEPVKQAGDSKDGQSQPLIELCYISKAKFPMESDALERLKQSSNVFNHAYDVTGVLTYDERTQQFLQILEGPEETVQNLMNRIIADERHRDVDIRFQAPINERTYQNWRMGFLAHSNIRDADSKDEAIAIWFTQHLGLEWAGRKSRSHRWIVDSIRRMVA